MIDFVKKHWRALLASALVAGVFFSGRLSVPDKPAKVETQERVVYKDRVVTVEKRVAVQAEAKQVVVYRTRVVKPDGTKIEHEVSKTETAKAATTASAVAQEQTTKVKEKEHTLVVNEKPQWRIGVLAGIDVRKIRLVPPPTIGDLTLGITVEHRVLGGLSLGGWVLTSGPTVGLSVSYEF